MKMHRIETFQTAASARATVASALLCFTSSLHAAPPHENSGPEPSIELQIVTGKVVSVTKNDHDDVDGLLLDDDRGVRFPPQVGKAVSEFVKVGDEVRVLGRDKAEPDGRVVMAMVTLESNGRAVAPSSVRDWTLTVPE